MLATYSVTELPVRKGKSFRSDINGLRAIAVVLVVLFHFDLTLFEGGFLGVDVFFVISGFLMTKIIVTGLEGGSFSFVAFMMARVRRIFPALLVLCLILLLLGWFSLEPADYKMLAYHAVSSLLFFSNITYWMEAGYFDSSSKEKWLLHTWSLSVEWQFYLLLPIVLIVIWSIFRSKKVVATVLVAAFFLSLLVSVFGTSFRPLAAYFWFPSRAWEMLIGGLIYLAPSSSFLPDRASRFLVWFGLVVIFGSSLLINELAPWPGSLAVIPVVSVALILWCHQSNNIILSNPISNFLGNASYSIYLWHWPVAVAFTYMGMRGTVYSMVIGIGLSLLLGYCSYRLVEGPVRNWGVKLALSKEWVLYAVALVAVGVLGVAIYKTDGALPRLGADEERYMALTKSIDDWEHPGTNCHQGLYAAECKVNGGNNGLVMFIGDSFAEQWYPRYGEKPLSDYSTLFITKGACIPARDIKREGSQCSEFVNYAWQRVFQENPEKLVIASIWVTYFFDFYGNRSGKNCRVEGDSCIPITSDDELVKAFDKFELDVARAENEGIKVYILAQTPLSGLNYPEEKLSEIASIHMPYSMSESGINLKGIKNFSVSPSQFSQKVIVDRLASIAKSTGAHLVRPTEHMCNNDVCPFVSDGDISLYKDLSHLTASYVKSDKFVWLDDLLGLKLSE